MCSSFLITDETAGPVDSEPFSNKRERRNRDYRQPEAELNAKTLFGINLLRQGILPGGIFS